MILNEYRKVVRNMWKWNVYFRVVEATIRCPVEAASIQDAVNEACRKMRNAEVNIVKIERRNRIN